MENLLVYGNAKLGAISNFSLPAKKTCPGINKFCHKYCYGVQNWYRESHVIDTLNERLTATKMGDFVPLMVEEIKSKKIKIVRIHTTGDFYSNEYIQKWSEIVKQCSSTKFYGYTRSWRVPELEDSLSELCRNMNVILRASVDFTHKDRPSEWATFSVVDGEGKRCPHDLGKVAYCRDCGICWNSYTPIYVRVR